MDVVRIIRARIEAQRAAVPDVIAIRLDRALVGEDGVVILAHPHINVRGHVDQMSGRRRVIPQPVGGGQSVLRMRSRLDGVNVEMVRTRMIGITRRDVSERGEDFLRLGPGRALTRPVIRCS